MHFVWNKFYLALKYTCDEGTLLYGNTFSVTLSQVCYVIVNMMKLGLRQINLCFICIICMFYMYYKAICILLQELTEEGLPFLILFHHIDDTETPEKYKSVVARELLAEKSE